MFQVNYLYGCKTRKIHIKIPYSQTHEIVMPFFVPSHAVHLPHSNAMMHVCISNGDAMKH